MTYHHSESRNAFYYYCANFSASLHLAYQGLSSALINNQFLASFNTLKIRKNMEIPLGIKQAIIAILGTLAISTLLALYELLIGASSGGEFIFAIIIYALLCILPYKISHQSNAARYVYLGISIVSMLSIFAFEYEEYKLELIFSLVLIPVEIFILYRLFQKEASSWFLSK